jgi:hypothetical protein
VRVLDFAQKHKSWLGNIWLIIFILCFAAHDMKANIEDARVNAEEPMDKDTAWSRDEEGFGYTLAGWERATGARPISATWNSLPDLANCGGGGGWSNRPSNTPRQQKASGVRWNKCKRCSIVERAPPQSRIALPASSQPCEALVLHFCLPPKCRQLRRAAAELMHLTKYYLATGISAFTPESLW